MLDRITGKAASLRDQNIAEAYASLLRERAERDRLIFDHIEQRRGLDANRLEAAREARLRAQELKVDFRRYAPVVPNEPVRLARLTMWACIYLGLHIRNVFISYVTT